MKDNVAVGQCNTLQERKINLKHKWFHTQTQQHPNVYK